MPRNEPSADPSFRADDPLYGPASSGVEHAREQARELRAKQEEGDWYGCFECVALDSAYLGHRMVLTFGADQRSVAKLGDRAPDTRTFGPGWKFLLRAQLDNPDEAVAWLHRVGDYR
jgi:hypothetical protein